MNKYNVEKHMETAVAAINKVFPKGNVDKSMRSKMSAFGAAVMMSGKKSALAYYKKNEETILEMLYATYRINENENQEKNQEHNIIIQKVYKFLIDDKIKTEDLLERSVALKLALNLFIKE